MSRVDIRRATPVDRDVLVGLIAGFRDHLGAGRPSDAELRSHLPRSLEDPEIEFHTAWLDGHAVGFAQVRFHLSVWAPGREAHLEDLFVAPEGRRRGVGRALLRCIHDRAVERGASRLTLATNQRNVEAQALYRSEGFAPQAHPRYPGGSEALWSRRLEPGP